MRPLSASNALADPITWPLAPRLRMETAADSRDELRIVPVPGIFDGWELERLWRTYEMFQKAPWLLGEVLWPTEDQEKTLSLLLPARSILLGERDPLPVEPIGWRLGLIESLAAILDQVHSGGARVNSLDLATLIVDRDSLSLLGLALPLALTTAQAGADEVPLRFLDCRLAAPELQRIAEAPLNPAVDFFALGVLAYHLLTGQPLQDLPACGFEPMRLDDGLGPSTREFFEDALAVVPSRRPASGRDFVRDLRAALVRDASRGGPRLAWAWQSDVGLGGRDNNEDACGAMHLSLSDGHGSAGLGVFVVADGMGGCDFGERASSLCVERLQADVAGLALLDRGLPHPERWTDFCRAWTLKLNDEALSLGRRLSPDRSVGSTLTALVVIGPRTFLLHAGDSRLYRVRDGRTERLTQIQTLAHQLFLAGDLRAEDIETCMFRNVLTSSIGSQSCEPQVEEIELRTGDLLLLCSDGAMEGRKEEDLTELATLTDVEEVARQVLAQCKAGLLSRSSRAESDNMTVVALRVVEAALGAAPVPASAAASEEGFPETMVNTQPQEQEVIPDTLAEIRIDPMTGEPPGWESLEDY